jgi:hypothetical protein
MSAFSCFLLYLPDGSYLVLINKDELLNEKCFGDVILLLIFFCEDDEEDDDVVVSILIFIFFRSKS